MILVSTPPRCVHSSVSDVLFFFLLMYVCILNDYDIFGALLRLVAVIATAAEQITRGPDNWLVRRSATTPFEAGDLP